MHFIALRDADGEFADEEDRTNRDFRIIHGRAARIEEISDTDYQEYFFGASIEPDEDYTEEDEESDFLASLEDESLVTVSHSRREKRTHRTALVGYLPSPRNELYPKRPRKGPYPGPEIVERKPRRRRRGYRRLRAELAIA